MTDRKPELPKLDEETLEMMRACGYDELDRTHIALEGRESQLLSALTKIAALEDLLRESRDLNKELAGNLVLRDSDYMERAWLPKLQDVVKRVDALLEGK
jgi:hypothetical protein